MPETFAAFILTHGRADRVATYASLRKSGYTGKIYLIIDDEDEQGQAYRDRYCDEVIEFCKSDIAERFDEADNFDDRRSIFYARNACFEIAKTLKLTHFIELDDDYVNWFHRFDHEGFYGHWSIADLDATFASLCEFLDATPFASVALSQGGDHLGGKNSNDTKIIKSKRKAMNTFVCRTDRPFEFVGRINEDANTYASAQHRGIHFLTFYAGQVIQKQTQASAGGMTDIYRDNGTYVKSFYSCITAPSCVTITRMGHHHQRIHHRVDWDHCAPKIIREGIKNAV